MKQIVSVETAKWSLLTYNLGTIVGGSGVSVVDVIVCDVRLSDGTKGFGFSYAIGGFGAGALKAARDLSDAHVVGKPFFSPEATWRDIKKACNRTGRGPNFVGLGALDVALWDAYAISLGQPLGVAMGGKPRSVKVYGSGGYRPDQGGEKLLSQIEEHQKAGFQAIKLRLSGTRADEAVIREARDACGNETEIFVDLNEKTTVVNARFSLDMCLDYGVVFAEEPLASGDVIGHRALAARYPGFVATGEHLQGAVESAPFLNEQLCGAIQPDLAMMGGLTESLMVARWAEQVGIEVMPHFLPGLFIQLAAAAPNLNWLEDFPLLEPVFSGLPEAADGKLRLPDVLGHGLQLLPEMRQSCIVDT